jgi:putative ABC transport system permease protein
MEVVLGSVVAEKTGLRVGDTFLSSHGLTESGESHGQESYRVTGILAPSGMVYDQLILTSVSSLWRVHHLPEPLKGLGRPSKLLPGMYVQDSSGVQITSVLVRFRNALGALQLPRVINEKTVMQAASPAFELSRLYSIMGAGLEVIEGFTWLVFILSAFSVFISLLGSLRERQYDLAIMRTMGATRIMVFGLVVLEGFLLAFAGTVSGVTAGHIVIGLLPGLGAGGGSSFTGAVFHPGEWYVVGAGLAAGLLSAALPAWRASRTDIHKVLAR